MEIRNDTPFEANIALGMGPDRRPWLSVVLKATFTLPEGVDGQPAPADDQLPILGGDEYFKGDVTGSVEFESDAVVFKPRADVILIGHAHAPGGKPVPMLDVALRVGPVQQAVRVFGDRRWVFPTRAVMVPVMSDPEPFAAMPLIYERAFGGFDHKGGAWSAQNHIGRGFIGKKTRESVDGKPLPNLEDPRQMIRSWDDQPAPVGFGFYGRSWQPRTQYTGRNVEDLDPTFGLPADYNHAFNNGAHPALQAPGYLQGNEEVELRHVTPDGYRRFRLPGLAPTFQITLADPVPEPGDAGAEAEAPPAPSPRVEAVRPLLDTVVLLPDDGVFYQVWRGGYPLNDLDLSPIKAIDIALASS